MQALWGFGQFQTAHGVSIAPLVGGLRADVRAGLAILGGNAFHLFVELGEFAVWRADAGARLLGEFAIGTNEKIDRFTGQILFDEKIGGSFHMALGHGYPEAGTQNKDSAIHWDMICDLRKGGAITVDGELFYKDGKFVVDF